MKPVDQVDPLAAAILCELAAVDDQSGMSLPRMAKRLDTRVSVLLRQMALMGEAAIGGVPGPALVRVVQDENRWRASLLPAGRALFSNSDAPHEAG